MAAVCPGGSTVPATIMIVVEYRLVYQLIGRLQAAKVYNSTVGKAAVLNYITTGGAVKVNYSTAGRQ